MNLLPRNTSPNMRFEAEQNTVQRKLELVPKIQLPQEEMLSVLLRLLRRLFYPCCFSALHARSPVRHYQEAGQKEEKNKPYEIIYLCCHVFQIHSFSLGGVGDDIVLKISGAAG